MIVNNNRNNKNNKKIRATATKGKFRAVGKTQTFIIFTKLKSRRAAGDVVKPPNGLWQDFFLQSGSLSTFIKKKKEHINVAESCSWETRDKLLKLKQFDFLKLMANSGLGKVLSHFGPSCLEGKRMSLEMTVFTGYLLYSYSQLPLIKQFYTYPFLAVCVFNHFHYFNQIYSCFRN